MQSRIFPYEEMQVNRFLHDLYALWGGTLDEEMCIGEGWIVYMEGREKYKSDISDVEYWGYVRDNVKKRLEELKKIRNERMSLESKLSLNQTVGELKEEIGTIMPGKTGDFVNGIALWDYAKRLGTAKYDVLKLMNAREEDYDIMQTLHLGTEEYYEIKRELRDDFLNYHEIEKDADEMEQ